MVQHDQEFIAPFDLPMVLCKMSQHKEVKYVGLSSALAAKFEVQVKQLQVSGSRNMQKL